MLKEALELIQATAREAQTAKRLELPGDGRTAQVQIGGELKTIVLPPGCRQHVVYTLAGLVAFVKAFDGGRPVVWHSHAGVVCVLDDADRRDRVTFPLTPSPQIVALQRLAGQRSVFSQAEFIRLLRVVFGVDPAIVAGFRRLDWATSLGVAGEVNRTADRMGKDVRAAVVGAADLPEDLLLMVPIYVEPGETDARMVRCLIEFDLGSQKIELVPLPGEVEAAIAAQQADIGEGLKDALDGVPVYYGTP